MCAFVFPLSATHPIRHHTAKNTSHRKPERTAARKLLYERVFARDATTLPRARLPSTEPIPLAWRACALHGLDLLTSPAAAVPCASPSQAANIENPSGRTLWTIAGAYAAAAPSVWGATQPLCMKHCTLAAVPPQPPYLKSTPRTH